jgi:hypothetical protein
MTLMTELEPEVEPAKAPNLLSCSHRCVDC